MDKETVKTLIELYALQCDLSGMMAENQKRLSLGESIAYDESSFEILSQKMRALNNNGPLANVTI